MVFFPKNVIKSNKEGTGDKLIPGHGGSVDTGMRISIRGKPRRPMNKPSTVYLIIPLYPLFPLFFRGAFLFYFPLFFFFFVNGVKFSRFEDCLKTIVR